MNLLCVSNPKAYQSESSSVFLTFQALAAHRDFRLHHVATEDLLNWKPGSPTLPVCIVEPLGSLEDFHRLERAPAVSLPIRRLDLAYDMTLKPLPEGFMERLRDLEERLLFLNSPKGITAHLEVHSLPELAGEFLTEHAVGFRVSDIAPFLEKYREVVLKLPNSCCGDGVYRIWEGRKGIQVTAAKGSVSIYPSWAEMEVAWSERIQQGFLLTRFLEGIREGDKRVLTLGGEIFGAFQRVPVAGSWVTNLTRGASSSTAEVNDFERDAIGKTVPWYQDRGIALLGYDFATDTDGQEYILEINAGNVGGIPVLERLSGEALIERFCNFLSRYANRSIGTTIKTGRGARPE